jgi:hypothetical protein
VGQEGWIMARIEGVSEKKASFTSRIAYWFCQRRFGKVVEPLQIIAHHGRLSKGYVAFEFALDNSRLVDARLKALAEIKAATLIGCPF